MPLEDGYSKLVPVLDRAKEQLRELLESVIVRIEDRRLVRARLSCVRVKSLASLVRKAREKGWTDDEALLKNGDWVGGRVVCNNVDDVYRFVELLRERITDIWEPPPLIEDYIREPQDSGYRAVHVNFVMEISKQGTLLASPRLAVEVQVRTLLQDGWGELTHEDVYHRDIDLPPDLRDRAKDLARHLELADATASEIRERITALRAPDPQADLKRVSEAGLALAFSNAFGRQPKNYAVRIAMTGAQGESLESLEGLPELLRSEEYRNAINEAETELGPGIMSAEDLLEYAPIALARGIKAAAKVARRRARAEWREIDRQWRSEMKAELPETYQGFLEQLRDGQIGVELFAEFFGALTRCAVCSTELVDPYSFAEGVLSHYDVDEDTSDIETYVLNSGVETPAFENSSLCNHHAEVMHRDD